MVAASPALNFSFEQVLPLSKALKIPTTHLAFYTAIWLIFFDLEFSDVTIIEFHGDSESAINFGI